VADTGIFVIVDIGDGLTAADEAVIGVEFDQQVEFLVDQPVKLFQFGEVATGAEVAPALHQRTDLRDHLLLVGGQAALGRDIQVGGEGRGNLGNFADDSGRGRRVTACS